MSLDNPFVPSHDPRIGASFDYVKKKKSRYWQEEEEEEI